MSELTAFERFKEKVVGKVDAARSRCWLFHPWTRWSVIGDNKITSGGPDGRWIGQIIVQKRTCQRCGLTQVKKDQWEI